MLRGISIPVIIHHSGEFFTTFHAMADKLSQRLSVSLPASQYAALHRLAEQKQVSIAWVMRDAVRAYIQADSPLYNELQSTDRDSYVRTR